MPTAPDSSVFIRWNTIEVTPVIDSDLLHINAQVTVNVAGELISTRVYTTATSIGSFLADLDAALEDKRLEFVSA